MNQQVSPCYYSFLTVTQSYHSKVTHINSLHTEKTAYTHLLFVFSSNCDYSDILLTSGYICLPADSLQDIMSVYTAKPTERQNILTILADSLAMQSVSQQFKFLWKSVRIPCFLTQFKHSDWPHMFACRQQPAARHYSRYSLYIDTANIAN